MVAMRRPAGQPYSKTKVYGKTRLYDVVAEEGAPGAATPASSEDHAAETESRSGSRPPVRVLVVFGFQYRSYGQAIAGAIGALRPRAEVVTAQSPDLHAELARVSPHLVISSHPSTAARTRPPAWVELPSEPGVAGSICFGGRCSEARDLVLEDLLAAVDRTEELVEA